MRKTTRPARRSTATKVIASVALVAGAASVAGMGTFGAFTDTTTADQAVKAGTIGIDAPATIDDQIENLVPGDTVQRAFELTRDTNSEEFGSITLTSAVADYDGSAGFSAADAPVLSIAQCDTAWVKGADNKLTCNGGEGVNVLVGHEYGKPKVLAQAVTDNLNADGATSYLRLQLVFPNTKAAQNHLQGKSATLKLKFDATQRAGEAR